MTTGKNTLTEKERFAAEMRNVRALGAVLETALADGLLDRLNAIARPRGCVVECKTFGHGIGFSLRAGAAGWHLGHDPATAEGELRGLLDLNPQVAYHARPSGGAWCRRCGGPVADGGSDCGECQPA